MDENEYDQMKDDTNNESIETKFIENNNFRLVFSSSNYQFLGFASNVILLLRRTRRNLS